MLFPVQHYNHTVSFSEAPYAIGKVSIGDVFISNDIITSLLALQSKRLVSRLKRSSDDMKEYVWRSLFTFGSDGPARKCLGGHVVS